jgi:hypothetical protein
MMTATGLTWREAVIDILDDELWTCESFVTTAFRERCGRTFQATKVLRSLVAEGSIEQSEHGYRAPKHKNPHSYARRLANDLKKLRAT